MHTYLADLHVHTVLSPCAEVEMIPPLIVETAVERGIQLLAITDHNASANVEAVQAAAAGADLTVLPGMELQTREEVHLLCLFDTLTQLADWQAIVDDYLPDMQNNPDYFGEQFVVDATGEFVRREERLLLTSTQLTLAEAVIEVTRLGGLAIPAHIDRTAFGLLPVLGFVPADAVFDALELSRHLTPDAARARYPELEAFALIQDGDAHRLNEFLGTTEFSMASPTVAELRLALHHHRGRSFAVKVAPTEGL